MKFVIEHMEPKLYKWCTIEYKSISRIVGKNNLIITNIRRSDRKKLERYGNIHSKSISSMKLKRCCILDQSAKNALSPWDCKKFSYLIFGGILGDYPREKRTGKLSSSIKCEKRNLGNKQMPTDNAVLTAKMICDGKKYEDIKFKDGIEIKLREGESVSFPFRYVVADGKPFISKELVEFLRKRKGF